MAGTPGMDGRGPAAPGKSGETWVQPARGEHGEHSGVVSLTLNPAKSRGVQGGGQRPLQGRGQGSVKDVQHHRWPPCRLMEARPPLGSWNRLVTRSVLTFHARTVPSRLQEKTSLEGSKP